MDAYISDPSQSAATSHPRASRPASVGRTFIALALVAACSDPISPNARVEDIEKISADEVTFVYGSNATFTPTVRLTDAKGNPVRGAEVRFVDTNVGGIPVTVKSDANGTAAAPPWIPRYVGSNQLRATVGERYVTFRATGHCPPARTLGAGDHVSGRLESTDCTELSGFYDAVFDVFHDRFAMDLASQQSVHVAWSFTPDPTHGSVLLEDARRQVIGWPLEERRLRAILPAGRYELDVAAAEGLSDVYSLDIDGAESDAGCNGVFLLRGVQFSRELSPLDCLRTEGGDRYTDWYVLVLLRGETTTVDLSSAGFAAQLEVWPDYNDGRVDQRKISQSEVGAPARIVHACAEDRCIVRIVVTSTESVRTGGYSLSVQ